MSAPKPLTDAERETILARHASGLSCRQIAKEVGRSHTVCARIVRESGAKTDTAQTAAATATRMRRVTAGKLDRIEALLAEAEELRRGMWEPVTETMNTPHGPMFIEREPTAREIKTTIDAVTKILETVEKLWTTLPTDETAEQRSLMGNLMAGIKAVRAQLDDPKGA